MVDPIHMVDLKALVDSMLIVAPNSIWAPYSCMFEFHMHTVI